VLVRDVRGALDGAQEGAQTRPVDCRRRAVPVLSERRVDRQGSLGLHRSAQIVPRRCGERERGAAYWGKVLRVYARRGSAGLYFFGGEESVRIRYILVDDESIRKDVVQMLRERRLARARCAANKKNGLSD
jgi:hypothetical protein